VAEETDTFLEVFGPAPTTPASDDDLLMESMISPVSVEEPAEEIEVEVEPTPSETPNVLTAEESLRKIRRRGRRAPVGFERRPETMASGAEESSYRKIRDHVFQGQRNEGKSVKESYDIARKTANHAFLYGLLDDPPLEDFEPPTGIVQATGRVLARRRLIDTKDAGDAQSSAEKRMADVRKQERAYRALIEEEGSMAALAKAWSSGPKMTQEEADAAGIDIAGRQEFFGRDLAEGVDPEVGFLEDPYIPYGLKNIPNLIERAAIKTNIPNMFANLFLEEDEKQAFIKETNLALPTENFERIVEIVELNSERGKTDEETKKELKNQLAFALTMQSFRDLPSGFQVKEPSIDAFEAEVTANPDFFVESPHEPLANAAKLVLDKADKKKIQFELNRVALGYMPNSVIAGSIPSTVNLIDEAVASARRVIKAKGEAGKASRVLAQRFADTTFSTEKINDEVMVVENTFGKVMRMLGLFTEGVAELDVTGGTRAEDVNELLRSFGFGESTIQKRMDITKRYGVPLPGPDFLMTLPFLPASRDFYYNYGIRDIESTWLSRVLGNLATGSVGNTVHMTDEARKDGFERGDSEFHTKLFIGGSLDFIVPWEKLHIGPVAHATKAAARGRQLVKLLNAPGYKTRAFLAGASPALYDRLYNVSERAQLALDYIQSRVGKKPTVEKLQRILDEDDLAQQAVGKKQPLPKVQDGRQVEGLTLNERNFAEDLVRRMEGGQSFRAAFEDIKKGYKPDVFETAADVATAVTRHVMETDESLYLFSRGKPGSPNYKAGIIPWQLEPQIERAMGVSGIKYADVKAALKNDIGGAATGYLEGLRALRNSGSDLDTLDLRTSEPYLKFRKGLESLVKSGEMTPEQKVVLLAIMETRAHNSAAATIFRTIKEPEDFFKNAKIKTSRVKNADGSTGPTNVRIVVGKKTADINLKSVDKFIDILKADDNLSMRRLFGGDNELLIDLMGKAWTSRFIGRFDNVENSNKAQKMTTNMLSDDGRKAAEEKLRAIIEASGRLSTDTVIMRELYANLASVYGRTGEAFKKAALTKSKIIKLDNLLKPDQFFKNAAVVLNRGRPRRPGTIVRVSNDFAERVTGEIKRAAGTKRVFADIDVNPEYVRQSMGVTKRTTQIDAPDALARAVGYVVAETMKKSEQQRALSGMALTRLTPATFAARKNVKVIRSRVNGRMAAVLGIQKRSALTGNVYLDAKNLKEMADSKTQTLTLSQGQQDAFKVFLQRLASEPFVANKIPDELVGPNGRVDQISFKNYNRVVELVTDVEASSFSRRTVYTEAIPRSLAYALLGSMRAKGADIVRATGFLEDQIAFVRSKFFLDDPLRMVRPELKEVIEAEIAKLQQTRSEVVKLIRDARRADPDASIEQIFDMLRNQLETDMRITMDKVDLIVGEYDLVTGKPGKKGMLHILNEFTQSEISRVNRDFAKSQKKQAPSFREGEQAIVEGTDIIEEPGARAKYTMFVPPNISRIQYLTRNTTRSMLQHLCDTGGINGISERVSTALQILEGYSSAKGMTKADLAKLSDQDRVMIASAIMTIRDQLTEHATYLKHRGGKILSSLAGKRFNLDQVPEFKSGTNSTAAAAAAYKAFHRGGDGFRILYDTMIRYAAEVGADPEKMARYSPAQAYLEMVVRLMAEDKILGMYDQLIKVGMPGARENYRIPRRKISPTGAEYSIETPHAFHIRVRNYMDMIFNRSRDIREQIELPDGRIITREAGGPGADYPTAAFERFHRRFDSDPEKFEDLDAALAAEEALVRFGVRTQSAGEALTEIVFPDGSVTYGPAGIKQFIDDAIERTAAVGFSYDTVISNRLSIEEFGAPFAPEIQKTGRVRSFASAASAFRTLQDMFPISFSMIKRGITTGIFVPIPAYYAANFLGGALQLVTAVNPVKAASMLVKNPKMVGAVMARMFGDGEQFSSTAGGAIGAITGGVAGGLAAGPLGAVAGVVGGAAGGGFTGRKIGRGYQPFGNHIIVAKNGMIYNADQVAELSNLYGLNSSFITAETQRSMADDVQNYLRENPTLLQKGSKYGSAWNDYLADCATAIDNFYRVSIFVDQLNDGIAPSQAASLARRAAFDYGALTDFEKKFMRQFIMFYSYLSKNMELFYDTMMTEPSRVTNQLRLSNGLQRATLEDDPQLVLPAWFQPRAMVGMRDALTNTHAIDSRMYVMPPIPITDSLLTILDVYDTVRGDEESVRKLFAKQTPWVQAFAISALKVDPFYGTEIDRYNKVPPWLMEFDLAITGGFLRRTLKVRKETHRNNRLRILEGDEDRQYFRAHEGVAWWYFRNMLQVPGAGRSMLVIDQLDRTNLGVVEGMTELLRTLRVRAEEAGLADEREFEFLEGDTADPRVGFDVVDEFLGLFGIRTQLVPNADFARARILQDINMTYKKKYPQSQDPLEQALEKIIIVE